jgi:hypothetical protein
MPPKSISACGDRAGKVRKVLIRFNRSARAPAEAFGATLLPWNRQITTAALLAIRLNTPLQPAECNACRPAGGHCNPEISASNKGDPGA